MGQAIASGGRAYETCDANCGGPAEAGPRVAIVHDWFVTYAGAEKVVEQMLAVFPDADIFSLVDFLPDDERAFLGGRPVTTTFLQRLPGARKRHRQLLPLMPIAIEQLDVSGYDIVLSSSHAVAKGVITGPDQLHICYCHTPCRYAWDLQHEYLGQSGMKRGFKSVIARMILHYFRIWDARTSASVDHFIGNSRYIVRRIAKVYRREAAVVHPPVAIDLFPVFRDKEEYYVTASRMVPYKRMSLIAEAFAGMPDRHLVIIGDGPDMEKVRAFEGPNVRVLGHVSLEQLRYHVQRARAFVFAAEEDFGIAPVEAQACGTPVIAYGAGGALDSVVDGRTGVFFGAQDVAAVQDAVRRFEAWGERFDPDAISAHAASFSEAAFRRRLRAFVMDRWSEFNGSARKGIHAGAQR
jgi:glycosyltransferase involved in cell wall biosynthesis